jgi:hypothetical protein
MTQTLYAHMNKIKIKKKRQDSLMPLYLDKCETDKMTNVSDSLHHMNFGESCIRTMSILIDYKINSDLSH